MSDTQIGPGGELPPLPNNYNPVAGVNLPNPGTPVYITADGEAHLARANAAATSQRIGLTTAPAAAGQRVNVRYAGPLALTAAQVAAILDTGSAFTPGAPYFVSAALAGKLTVTPPVSTNLVAWCGTAIGPDAINIALSLPFVGAGG